MFALINTRWFYADETYILALHPAKMVPILFLKKGVYKKSKVITIAKACKMELLDGKIIEENGDKYLLLKEARSG